MSAPGEIQSTPSKYRVASKSQAGNQDFKKEDVKKELEQDVGNAVKCGFDQLIKYFLYLVLKEDSEQKKELDRLQDRIEALQSRIYRQEGNSGGGTGETVDSGSGNSRSEIPEEEVDNVVDERDYILGQLFDDALEAVLEIANIAQVKILFNKCAEAFMDTHEKKRYGPHIELCNDLLDRLRSANGKLPIRDPDKLNIRFQRNDPSLITSNFQGTKPVDRDPDVIISSWAALSNLHGQSDWDCTSSKKLEWPFVLSCVEYKVHNRNNPERVSSFPKKSFKFHKLPVEEADHARLLELDATPEKEGTVDNVSNTSGSKRTHGAANLGDSEGQASAKKPRTLTGTASGSKAKPPVGEVTVDRQTQQAIEGRVQCASYALEMLSHGAGVHHVINLLFTDGIMWIWYYDRQGIIQSTGIGVFVDFPRFVLLLLALQRFSAENWGIIREFNPKAMHEHDKSPFLPKEEPKKKPKESRKGKNKDVPENPAEPEPVVVVPNPVVKLGNGLDHMKDFTEFWKARDDKGVVKLSEAELKMNQFLSNQPHCLAGRATAVVPATGRSEDGTAEMEMVCKVYHPEVQRRHEGLTMQVIYKIVEKEDPASEMLKFLPKFYFHGDVKGTTTHRVRSMLRCEWKGHRTMRIIGMKRLHKVTSVSGWEFVKAWLEGVTCHAFLWKNFVEHGDPSVSNLMYDPENKHGVLTDFDLSLLQWEPRVFGTDRTGTVPFMALELSTREYWDGKIKRYYHHELESFIWILPYVFLLYKNGVRQRGTLVDSWRTSNYDTCREKKSAFYLRLPKVKQGVQDDFRDCWSLADGLCNALRNFHNEIQNRLHEQVAVDQFELEEDLWTRVLKELQKTLSPEFATLLNCWNNCKPFCAEPTDDMKEELQGRYRSILDPQERQPAVNSTER